MKSVKQGKSYTRRYYERLFERFEKESKKMDKKTEMEKEKQKIVSVLENGRDNNLLTVNEFNSYMKRLQNIRVEQDQLIRTNLDITEKRERLIKANEKERKTLSMKDLKEQVRLLQKEKEHNSSGNSLRDDIQRALTEEESKEVNQDKERE